MDFPSRVTNQRAIRVPKPVFNIAPASKNAAMTNHTVVSENPESDCFKQTEQNIHTHGIWPQNETQDDRHKNRKNVPSFWVNIKPTCHRPEYRSQEDTRQKFEMLFC
jgi:hypothetical protein